MTAAAARGVGFAGLLVILSGVAAVAEETRVTREAVVAAVERGRGPVRGRADAPVTLVEFSDFRCSFCRKFWKETLPRIDAEYVRTGKVRLVYRHFVALGPPSARAAEAAECAAEQGKFWPYHDRLFESAVSAPFTEATFRAHAGALGLDSARFEACLASGRHAERVQGESEIARYLGASGTPTFLIGGRLLIGAQPFEAFKRVLDAALAEAAARSGGAGGAAGSRPARGAGGP